ncbi:MAG: hypothetical protein KGJ13_07220 [Patescibacteria group bacterium]|nr:hypothetical protein [Patescibacteria group bacterium]
MTQIPQDDEATKRLAEMRREQVALMRENLARILNQFPEAARLQVKYELLCAIMAGESANNGASIWSTMLADFAIGCANLGFEPRKVLVNLRHEAQKLIDQKLKEQGLTLSAPDGAKPN